MKRIVKSALSGILAVMLVVTMVPQAALAGTGVQDAKQSSSRQISSVKAGATDGKKIADAIDKFTDAMSKLAADTSEMSKLSTFLTRFGGVTNVASGVVGILQMAGVIQDPTTAKLNQILDTVKSMEDQLRNMDTKLDAISGELVKIEACEEIKDRGNKADARMSTWRTFQTSYCDPLKRMMSEYTGFVNKGIEDWWKKSTHDGVNVVYTKTKDGIELTYSINKFDAGKLPASADNEEVIEVNSSFALPGNCIPDTSEMDFNINKYRADFEAKMAESFIAAAGSKKILANDAFYNSWNKLSQADKQTQAKKYAGDILNTIIYHISCELMSADNQWVIGVMDAYDNYCKNVVLQDSGINARLQAMYYTHGFEGEIKKDIEDFCDGMVAQAGLYGQFALTCAGQCNLIPTADRQDLQNKFADTVIALSDKKEQAITGHNNYCYVTSTIMEQDQVQASATATVSTEQTWRIDALRDHSSTDWTITVPNILDDVYSQVLYHQYQTLNQGTQSFPEYLNKYGAFNDKDYTGTIMTKYVGAETFPLDDGITMTAAGFFNSASYFSSWNQYRIDVGNSSKVERDYFYVHDRVMVDEMDMSTGALNTNHMAGARAFYGEAHDRWSIDEPWEFYTENARKGSDTTGSDGNYTTVIKYGIDFTILKLTPVHDLNGDDETGNPFFAFNRAMFIDGISNHIGPIIENDRTHITSVKLNKTKFKYTGKAIKPKLTVKAGKKTLSAKDYSVKYLDNKAVGLGKVIVQGKGDYSGIHSKHFTITSKSGKALTAHTEAKMVSKGKNAMKIYWPAIKKADGYDVFFALCNHGSKTNKYKKVATVNGHKKLRHTVTGLKSGVSYKAKVKAFTMVDGKKKYIMTSPTMHAYSGGGTKHYTNVKSVTVKKTKVTLKKGKTYKIKATVTKLQKNKKRMPSSHKAKLRYRSINKKIATVNRYGKIKAKSKGTCLIYVFAHNGVGKLVHVTVK